MNLTLWQKIIAATTCTGVILTIIIVPLVTGSSTNRIDRSTENDTNANIDDLASTEETNDVYMYARGNAAVPSKLSKTELNHETKNFKCRYKNHILNCEISQIKTNDKKWYLANKMALLDKKIKVADLRDKANIFQIKLLESDWSKITDTKTTFMDVIDDNKMEHAYLEPLFSKHKDSTKQTFNHFVAKLVESKGNVNLKDTNFKCKFDNNRTNTSIGITCSIHSFDDAEKILNSKKYSDVDVFQSTKATNWQKGNFYLISFSAQNKMQHTRKEIHFFKGQDIDNSLHFEATDQKIFFDQTISDHIFIL